MLTAPEPTAASRLRQGGSKLPHSKWPTAPVYSNDAALGLSTVNLILIRWKNPGLLRARLEEPQGTQPFDKVILAVTLLASCSS